MAFSSVITAGDVRGNKRKFWGTWTNTATDTGGTITITGLATVTDYNVMITNEVGHPEPKVTVSGNVLTIASTYGASGNWSAEGI